MNIRQPAPKIVATTEHSLPRTTATILELVHSDTTLALLAPTADMQYAQAYTIFSKT
jgi:hypothetical protein